MVENRPNPYSLRIDPEVMDKIKQLAQENSRSVNKEIEYALRQYIRQIESKQE
ncbi:Arc family DNA-binding protein [Phascolarctobacterium faecium]|jgi:hypothetical protein|uniref:Arc family DNA-binding protein n=1 Tax=Phascolarctobacterium faecium TaxID=33025 RepID=UPI0032BFE496